MTRKAMTWKSDPPLTTDLHAAVLRRAAARYAATLLDGKPKTELAALAGLYEAAIAYADAVRSKKSEVTDFLERMAAKGTKKYKQRAGSK